MSELKNQIHFNRYQCLRFVSFILFVLLSFFTYQQYSSSYFIETTKILVVAHYNEDLDWLNLFIGDRIPYIVYTRSNDSFIRHAIPINKGREPVVYLRYIVDHYFNLPSLIAFIHGHRSSWHQKDPSDIVVALRALQWNKYTYMPLTSIMTETNYQLIDGNEQATVNFHLWQAVLQRELGSPPINGIKAPCCATFVVKREAILAHPKEFYSNISNYLLNNSYADHLTARTLEYTWHLIFGQPAEIAYRTCDIFICDVNGNISVQLAEQDEKSHNADDHSIFSIN